jgi:hypothetical protein
MTEFTNDNAARQKFKAIETYYKGYRFRSRLEARWAIFFDALNLKWVYEDEGFTFHNIPVRCYGNKFENYSGSYLPDFYFPELNYYMEIKGTAATEHENNLCAALSNFKKCDVFLFDQGLHPVNRFGDIEESGGSWFKNGEFNDSIVLWMKCPTCGKIDITYDGWVHYSRRCHCYDDNHRLKSGGSNHPDVVAALNRALSARFEHGESP